MKSKRIAECDVLRAAAGGERRGVRAADKRLNSAPAWDRNIRGIYKYERESNTSLYTAANITAYARRGAFSIQTF